MNASARHFIINTIKKESIGPILFIPWILFCYWANKPVLLVVPSLFIIGAIAFGCFGIVKSIVFIIISTIYLYYLFPVPVLFTLSPAEICIVGCFLFSPFFIRKDFSLFFHSLPNKASIFLLLFSIVLTTFYLMYKDSPYLSISFFGVSKVLLFLMGYVLMYYLLYYHKLSLRYLFISLITAGLIYVVTIIFLYWKIGQLSIIFSERIGTAIGTYSTLVGMVLDIIFPISLFFALRHSRSMVLKGIFLLFSLLFFLVIIFTYTRGSYLGLIVIACYFFLRKFSIYKLLFFIIIAAISLSFIVHGFLYRFNNTNQNRFGTMASNYGRVELVLAAEKMIKDNSIVFGSGMLVFNKAKYDYKFPLWLDRIKIMGPHNYYLDHFVGLGLFGFLGIVLFIVNLLVPLIRLKVTKDDHYFKLGLIFAIISVSLHFFVDSLTGAIPFSLPLFTVFASSAFLINKYKKQTGTMTAPLISTY